MYVFFVTECTQDLEKRDGSFELVPNLILLSRCVVNLKPWKMLMSIANSVEGVSTRSGKTP